MNIRAITASLAGCLAIAGAAPALASAMSVSPMAVALDSAVYVERSTRQGDGLARSLQLADRLSRGDRVVTILTWQKQRGAGGFTVVNPVPRKVAYQGSADNDEEVSVDGGRTWGRLGEIGLGTRLATAEDVTHVRWHVAPNQAARGHGRIAYSAIVR